MEEGDAILFGGDPLAFISRHYFPALMHQPAGLEMVSGAPATRLSTPFFLYPDEEAILDSRRTSDSLRTTNGQALPTLDPPYLPVLHFKLNVDDCRERWPWKQLEYYRGLVIGRDSDSFPGEPAP